MVSSFVVRVAQTTRGGKGAAAGFTHRGGEQPGAIRVLHHADVSCKRMLPTEGV
jgi:hypothetical protein